MSCEPAGDGIGFVIQKYFNETVYKIKSDML